MQLPFEHKQWSNTCRQTVLYSILFSPCEKQLILHHLTESQWLWRFSYLLVPAWLCYTAPQWPRKVHRKEQHNTFYESVKSWCTNLNSSNSVSSSMVPEHIKCVYSQGTCGLKIYLIVSICTTPQNFFQNVTSTLIRHSFFPFRMMNTSFWNLEICSPHPLHLLLHGQMRKSDPRTHNNIVSSE